MTVKLVSDNEKPLVNDTRTYWRLNDRMDLEECNRTERDAFLEAKHHVLADFQLGDFASVTTTFEGDDDFSGDDDPHPFMTFTTYGGDDMSETEGHRTWKEAIKAHRERVDKVIAEFGRVEPQLDLI